MTPSRREGASFTAPPAGADCGESEGEARRQRDLLPLPLRGVVEQCARKGLSRAVRQRVNRRVAIQRRVEETVRALIS